MSILWCFDYYSIDLSYNLKLGSVIPPPLLIFPNIVWVIQGLLQFHTILGLLSISVKNVIGILIRIALNLYVAFGSMDILTILILLIHEHEISFHLVMSFSISFINIIVFQCKIFDLLG